MDRFNKIHHGDKVIFYQITKEEFDYMNATEHINSIFALKSLIKFHYKNKIKEFYSPFKIKLIDLNLFYNVHITK